MSISQVSGPSNTTWPLNSQHASRALIPRWSFCSSWTSWWCSLSRPSSPASGAGPQNDRCWDFIGISPYFTKKWKWKPMPMKGKHWVEQVHVFHLIAIDQPQHPWFYPILSHLFHFFVLVPLCFGQRPRLRLLEPRQHPSLLKCLLGLAMLLPQAGAFQALTERMQLVQSSLLLEAREAAPKSGDWWGQERSDIFALPFLFLMFWWCLFWVKHR